VILRVSLWYMYTKKRGISQDIRETDRKKKAYSISGQENVTEVVDIESKEWIQCGELCIMHHVWGGVLNVGDESAF